ncbi:MULTISPECIES: exopolysaccharide biosynthesis polyprenyl glycosylphosphotransferase [unclassified Bradyrhizobium]|uniref:exopolysaccharide biosynthesis polyprenyl glycosylphosphotransferase n=1 Tax=unclassified Bradyrhizobium TaxID=2631580 RepID=UPI00247AFDDC|nr:MULTISPECIES: exopolysaccharide biosynthesis polyprenyl glycosylphosphotransferase [unclassified Bradyrhizobium]WGS18502.1 exopolysaccharide biosynthesis polyprenyl glycosylphosphotransferase [Bradyrhizobium sp. ISRA463]WGS25327.1 exopolysaccharide biosynthesis polyprenyl glycosylphosphotransferase [Bradyrhizobium sp. ISRA464]
MADQGLNLHQASRPSLRSGSDRGLGLVRRHRKSIVMSSLVSGDVAAAFAAGYCTGLLARAAGLPAPEHLEVTVLLVVFAFFVVGLYTGSGPGPYQRFRQRALGIGVVVAVWSIATIAHDGGGKIADLIVVQAVYAACLLLIGHYVEAASRALLMHVDLWGASTVLVGTSSQCRDLAQLLTRKSELGLKPIGLIRTADDDAAMAGLFPLPLIGTTTDLASIRPRTEIEVAIFTTAIGLAAIQRDCHVLAQPCRFMLLEDIRTAQSPWLRMHALETMLGIETPRNSRSLQNWLLKRMLDILLAVPLALLALPVVALAAMSIKLIDPGPAFFVQERIGHRGRLVKMHKLRTMYANSNHLLEEHLNRNPQARAEWRQFFKLRNDPRILPVIGNFLRRSSIDELPQLWNVIRGDMSLVGPRPLPAYHAEQLDEEFRSLRTSVLPGITGLWQVSSRSDGDLQVLREQDLFYIRNSSLWLDVYILLQTLPAVLGARGAR